MSDLALADPVLSANLYAAGHLDRLLEEALVPFWRCFRDKSEHQASSFWFLRYEFGGEHLKLRLHSRPEFADTIKVELQKAVEPVLAKLSPGSGKPSVRAERIPQWAPPPMDLEDQAKQKDLSLVFTRYHRSSISFGDNPYLKDDRYVLLMSSCLAAGCEQVLAAAADPSGEGLAQQRQLILWMLLISGIKCLPGRQTAYLAYHRDWLVRLPLLKLNGSREQGRELLNRLEAICKQRQGQVEFLAKWVNSTWGFPAAEEKAPFTKAIEELLEYLPSFANLPDARLDPYAEELSFPILFKVFHGLANQLGLNRLDEAFVCQALLRAVGSPEPTQPSFELLPSLVVPR